MNFDNEIIVEGIEDQNIIGAGKGGGGGHTPVEYPNTLKATQTVTILGAICEGPIASVDKVYFDDTGIGNYTGAKWEWRAGESSQTHIPGFSNVESVVTVGVDLKQGIPTVRDVTSSVVDAVGITLNINTLVQVTEEGDMVGYSVSHLIETRLHAGAGWVPWNNGKNGKVTVSGKAMSPYPVTFEVANPNGNGSTNVWGVRVTRLTRNDPSSKFQSTASWSLINEIQYKKLSYNNTALVGITADAQSTGGKTPRVSVLGDWMKIVVPNNYNPTARTYSGTWNGGLTAGRVFSNNPAWIVYDILTNERYGMGIPQSRIDLYSFYNAGVYNDGTVTYYDTDTSTTKSEPRFQFNGVLQTWENDWQLIQIVAATFHSAILDIGGLITCIQDRPTTMTSIFNNSNVIEGVFEYTGNSLQERHTVVNVTYNDPADRYKQRITTVEADAAYMNKYGYNSTEIAILGCTSEGQAMRSGKWLLESELVTTETVVFRVGLADAYLQPGQVIGILDNDYALRQQGGRLSVVNSTTSITTDRAITLPAGTSTITCVLSDGTIETKNINQSSGDFTTLTTSTAFSSLPLAGQPFVISTSNAAVRPFRIDRLTYYSGAERMIIEVQATFYDENKWSRVEGGLTIPAKQFSDINQAESAIPKSAVIKIVGVTEAITNSTWNNLQIDWQPGDTTNAYTYILKYTHENGQMYEFNNVLTPNFKIEDVAPGYYQFWIYAVNAAGVVSPEYKVEYVYGSSNQPDAPAAPALEGTLLAPTSVVVKGTTGTTFNSQDLVITWTDPNTVSSTSPTLMNYRVELWTSDGATLKNTYEVYAKEFVYTYAMNKADFGTPKRSVQIRVYCVDTRGKPSAATTNVFNNLAPGQQSVSIISGSDIVSFNFTTPPEDDHRGYQIHRSTTSTFTPSSSTQIYAGPDSAVMLPASPGTTYYYKVAAYDTFGQDGLNYSASVTSTTMSQKGYNYSYVGLTFTPTPATNTVSWTSGYANVVVNDVSTTYAINAGSWVSGGWGYIYYQVGQNVLNVTTNFDIANVAGRNIIAIYRGGSDLQVGNGKPIIDGSTILAATVGAAQLRTNEAIITGTAQIANSIITNAHIQNGVIDNAKIGQTIQSTNYVAGSAGWKLDKAAGLEINGGNFTLRNNVGDVILSTTGEVQGAGSAGGNLLANANFSASINASSSNSRDRPANWVYGSSYAGGTQWCSIWDNGYWGAYGPVAVMFHDATQVGTDHHSWIYQDVQIEPGKWYEASVYSGAHRCRTFLSVQFLNAARDTQVGSIGSSINQNLASFGNTYSDTVRLFCAGEAPTNAHWARIVIYKYVTDAGQADSYGFYGRAMFARCRKNQVTPSEWQTTGGMNGVGSINSSNMSTFIESASIGSAQIGNLSVGRIKIADRAVTDIISQTKGAQVAIEQTVNDYTNLYSFMHTDWQCPSSDAPYKVIFMFSSLSGISNLQISAQERGGSVNKAGQFWYVCNHELLQSSDGGATWGTYDASSMRTIKNTFANPISVPSLTSATINDPNINLNINMSVIPQPGVLYRMRTLYGKKEVAGETNPTGSNNNYLVHARFQIDNENTTHIVIPYWK